MLIEDLELTVLDPAELSPDALLVWANRLLSGAQELEDDRADTDQLLRGMGRLR